MTTKHWIKKKNLMDHDHEEEEGQGFPPHVLVFPYPAQGHVNSMLKLSELLCLGGLQVTLLLTNDIHGRLLCHSNVLSHFSRYSCFRFGTISDGLPEDHPRSADKTVEMFVSFTANLTPLLREFLISNRRSSNSNTISCIVADVVLISLAFDVAEEFGIPIICFCTSSICDLWCYFCVPKLVEAGEIPFAAGDNMDKPITSVPGMESFLRRRDLPSFIRGDLDNWVVKLLLNETRQIPRARGLILNTFEELEGPILAQTRTQCPKLYAIGPHHEQLRSRIKEPIIHSNSFWEEDRSCMIWLDSQPLRSVIYVSFGSVSLMTKEQLMEFWHGLVNSGKKFLWVIRPDAMATEKDDESRVPTELLGGTKERGYIVGWAPQREVLGHQAIGGFLTHSGWNSILESIVVGVPMICWPYLGDQQINSRFVEEIWKIGLDMKDTCDRSIIEKMVRDLMDVRGEEFRKSADRMAKLAQKAISEGGSSYCNLESLIADIKLMRLITDIAET